MKTTRFFTAIGLITAVWFSACTNDEPMDSNALPEGKYPLEIASVTMSVESSSEPWSADAPQTRVTESENGNSSVWEWDGTERIGVQIGDGKPGTYVLNEGKTITAENACYWASTATGQIVKAWFPDTDEPISLADQSSGLAYVLQTTETANFDKPVTLGFTHQLAKVRVVLDGTQAALAETMEVKGYTSCTHTAGVVSTEGAEQGWLKMKRTTYADGAECWEANVVPGTITLDNFVRINDQTAKIKDGFPTKLEATKMYTIDLTVGEPLTEITAENCDNISGTGNYIVSDNFGQTITVTGGSPTIYLENANINVGSGNAINITSGNPTIHVQGTSSISSGDGAGIYVAQGNTVTITGDSRGDQLTVRGGSGSLGIGGYIADNSNINCGNIKITNVSVIAYGSTDNILYISSGIGNACERATCGTVTIENATVHAYGVNAANVIFTSGIGNGYSNTTFPSLPVVNISNDSEVHVHRGGGNADYIGYPADSWNGTSANNDINLGGGSCTSSTVYCYTGNGNTVDRIVAYDANGNATEQ